MRKLPYPASESDARKGLKPKEQVKLCVDCRGEQQKRLESGLAATGIKTKGINYDSLYTPKFCFGHGVLILMTEPANVVAANVRRREKTICYAMLHDEHLYRLYRLYGGLSKSIKYRKAFLV